MEINVTIKIDDCELAKIVEQINAKKESDNQASIYARFFDESSPAWNKDPEYNMLYLKSQQEFANELLKLKGHLFLNEVYDLLGMPRSKEGQVVGWLFDYKKPEGDNFVSFDIFVDHNSDFVNGYSNTVLLDFNVDGNIVDRI